MAKSKLTKKRLDLEVNLHIEAEAKKAFYKDVLVDHVVKVMDYGTHAEKHAKRILKRKTEDQLFDLLGV